MTTPVYDSVAYLASDRFAVFNAAGDSFASEFAPGARLRADCGTDGVLLGTVASASHDGATGRTVVTTAMDGGAALTANLAEMLHGNDVPQSLCAHAALHALGGRDALPGATTGVSGLVSLASTAETQAGTSATKAVTPAGLAASAKGLIATNTTIYVATTGSDTTGTGALGAPYASIAKALASITGKLIASGVIVTIQVADGTYIISSSIIIDHPDADKIQILGNTSAETTAAISSIDTTAKTITVAGDYTASIQVGDHVGISGSGSNGLNGDYIVSGRSYSGGNTVITCSSETFSSSAVGGGRLVIKPCNKCKLVCSQGTSCFSLKKSIVIDGFVLSLSALNGYETGIKAAGYATVSLFNHLVITGFQYGVYATNSAQCNLYGVVLKNNAQQLSSYYLSNITVNGGYGNTVIDGGAWGVVAYFMSFAFVSSSITTMRNVGTSYTPDPAAGDGNYNSRIALS